MHVFIFPESWLDVSAGGSKVLVHMHLFSSTHYFYFKGGRRRKKSTLLPIPQINWTVFLWWKLKVEGKKLYRIGLLQCWCNTLRLCLSFLTHCCCFINAFNFKYQFLSWGRGWFIFPFLTVPLYFKTTDLFPPAFLSRLSLAVASVPWFDHNDNHKYEK